MDWFSKAFLKSSLVWLALGVTLGLVMSLNPAWQVYRPAHLHMNLLGFVAMMIFGVAYHVIPRFTGHALFSTKLAGAHWWLANVGLVLFICGLMARLPGNSAQVAVGLGGALSAMSAYVFVYNMWRTINAQAVPKLVGIAAPGALNAAKGR